MKRLLCIIALIFALVYVLAACGKDEITEPAVTVSDDGYIVVNGIKTEYKVDTKDEISVNSDGFVVVNGVTTGILADKDDVITVDDNGFVVVNGTKTEHKIYVEPVNENSQGLLFVLKDDNTYAVEIGNAKYESKITIPATYKGKPVTEIREFGYDSNTYLREIIIPEGVTTIGERAFYGCKKLTKLVLPNSVTHIEKEAFDESNLFSITIGENLTYVDYWLFSGCYKLVELINHSSIKIGYDDAGSDADIFVRDTTNIHTDESKVTNIGDYIFYSNEDTIYLMGYVGDGVHLVLPENYNNSNYKIHQIAFYEDKRIQSIVIPEAVDGISKSAFEYCRSLTSVSIANGVTSIGEHAFNGCTSLNSIVIPNTITNIYDYAFHYCTSLTDIYYTGTEENWLQISIGSSNEYFINATIHYNYIPE